MGLLSRLFGCRKAADQGDRLEMLQAGYKEDFDGRFFAPDTVWAAAGSRVYHSDDRCAGAEVTPIPESEAVRRGLRRCRRCAWPAGDPPAAGKKAVKQAKPVSMKRVVG